MGRKLTNSIYRHKKPTRYHIEWVFSFDCNQKVIEIKKNVVFFVVPLLLCNKYIKDFNFRIFKSSVAYVLNIFM